MTEKKNNEWKLMNRLNKLSEEYEDISELWNQWLPVADVINIDDEEDHKEQLEDWITHNFHKEDKTKHFICLCSHYPIKVHYLLRNNDTNERCIVGSCCINKFAPEHVRQQGKIIQGTKKGHRYCKLCSRKLPSSLPHWKSFHDKCYKRHLNWSNDIDFLEDDE